jgi:hypothetical protein
MLDDGQTPLLTITPGFSGGKKNVRFTFGGAPELTSQFAGWKITRAFYVGGPRSMSPPVYYFEADGQDMMDLLVAIRARILAVSRRKLADHVLKHLTAPGANRLHTQGMVSYIELALLGNLSLATALWRMGAYPFDQKPTVIGHTGEIVYSPAMILEYVHRAFDREDGIWQTPDLKPRGYAKAAGRYVGRRLLAAINKFAAEFPKADEEADIPPVALGLTKLSVVESIST